MDTRQRDGRTRRGGAEGGDRGREEGWRCLGRDGQMDCQTGVGEETDRRREGVDGNTNSRTNQEEPVEDMGERGQEAQEEASLWSGAEGTARWGCLSIVI